VWHLLTTEARSAVHAVELVTAGNGSEADVQTAALWVRYSALNPEQHAQNAAGWASAGFHTPPLPGSREYHPLWNPAEAARSAAKALATRATGPAPPAHHLTTRKWHRAWNAAYHAARATQADYVRDIFPPPGFTARLEPDWLTSTVVAMARQMDETGDFSAVPILADALQDAGCDSETVLQCCRAPGNNHVRGNWVVDLVLGR
jgi:hypothetical protein